MHGAGAIYDPRPRSLKAPVVRSRAQVARCCGHRIPGLAPKLSPLPPHGRLELRSPPFEEHRSSSPDRQPSLQDPFLLQATICEERASGHLSGTAQPNRAETCPNGVHPKARVWANTPVHRLRKGASTPGGIRQPCPAQRGNESRTCPRGKRCEPRYRGHAVSPGTGKRLLALLSTIRNRPLQNLRPMLKSAGPVSFHPLETAPAPRAVRKRAWQHRSIASAFRAQGHDPAARGRLTSAS